MLFLTFDLYYRATVRLVVPAERVEFEQGTMKWAPYVCVAVCVDVWMCVVNIVNPVFLDAIYTCFDGFQ